MKYSIRYALVTAAILPAVALQAQITPAERFAIKATADFGLGNVVNAKASIPGTSVKSSAFDFDMAFGWTFWKRDRHSLEANIGVGYGYTSVSPELPGLDYNYMAPADADMDDETYIRFYELKDIRQKIENKKLFIPVYLNYKYKLSDRFNLHALAGLKLNFNLSSEVYSSNVSAYSYGVYPQYDDLLIDASYLNDFGESVLGKDDTLEPNVNSTTVFLMAGAGVEVNICGPLAADLTLRYEGGLNNLFKGDLSDDIPFNAQTAPVTYTVAEGQKAKPLSDYLNRSRLSKLSLAVSLIYRF